MKTMTLDEVKNLPPLTEERLNEIKNFQNTDFSDCPKQTKGSLNNSALIMSFMQHYKNVKTTLYRLVLIVT